MQVYVVHLFGVIADLTPLQYQISAVVENITALLKGIGVALAILGIMVGGLMRATSFGNERRIAHSNQAIAAAVIGLAIVLLAQIAGVGFRSMFPS